MKTYDEIEKELLQETAFVTCHDVVAEMTEGEFKALVKAGAIELVDICDCSGHAVGKILVQADRIARLAQIGFDHFIK